jgi:hypothetical protein
MGEGQPPALDETEGMTSMILLIETVILGGVATALMLLVHVVRRLA